MIRYLRKIVSEMIASSGRNNMVCDIRIVGRMMYMHYKKPSKNSKHYGSVGLRVYILYVSVQDLAGICANVSEKKRIYTHPEVSTRSAARSVERITRKEIN